MIQKKVCMIGATGVGKTSLVRQFVESIFSEKYQATIGVKVDKKVVRVGNRDVTMMLWDIQGEDDEFEIRPSFLRGASGYMLVVDMTRSETLETAKRIQLMIEDQIGVVPFQIIFNKHDLKDEFEIDDSWMVEFAGEKVLRTSAKTGEGVEDAFLGIAAKML
ncbi:MAG: GTP-binding protein [Pyrinomonadaceae bacterium]|nr:GTP-binding protein [Pyrinomonadaceae bacterium]